MNTPRINYLNPEKREPVQHRSIDRLTAFVSNFLIFLLRLIIISILFSVFISGIFPKCAKAPPLQQSSGTLQVLSLDQLANLDYHLCRIAEYLNLLQQDDHLRRRHQQLIEQQHVFELPENFTKRQTQKEVETHVEAER